MNLAERAARLASEIAVEQLKLEIARLRRERFGTSSERSARIYTLIETAKLNRVDPQAWLADVLARLPDHPARGLDDLLPWNWTQPHPQPIAA
nr:transposase domain-containing protein [Methylorubrum rhodinum]